MLFLLGAKYTYAILFQYKMHDKIAQQKLLC